MIDSDIYLFKNLSYVLINNILNLNLKIKKKLYIKKKNFCMKKKIIYKKKIY